MQTAPIVQLEDVTYGYVPGGKYIKYSEPLYVGRTLYYKETEWQFVYATVKYSKLQYTKVNVQHCCVCSLYDDLLFRLDGFVYIDHRVTHIWLNTLSKVLKYGSPKCHLVFG